MKEYCVVYLSAGGIHYRFRCSARTKADARKECHNALGVKYRDITEVYEEE